ncbi:MAG: histidinol-phosphatase [Spirochaetes bacterium]|nr:histidinol-phosphatase [Spirochaetota bacterium]
MAWANYHTHSDFCDGTGCPEDYVESALVNDIVSLGFSSHCPVPVENDFSMPMARFDEYCKTIDVLKNKYSSRLEIYCGLEVDFVRDIDIAKDIDLSRLDYSIGSVHFLGREALMMNTSVDMRKEMLEDSINRDCSGSIKEAVEIYYNTMREMICTSDINIIGHLDIIKKNNKDNAFFNENDKWYRDLVIATLEAASKKNKIIEVNNGGITRKKIDTYYPSVWILEKCFEMNIPVTISSDAHSPSQLAAGFSETAKDLNDIGFKEIFILEQGKWVPKKFSSEGIEI